MDERAHQATCALVLLLFIVLLVRLRAILSPFIFAGFIAYVANPLVCLFERRQVPRNTAILITYGLIVVAPCRGSSPVIAGVEDRKVAAK